MCAAKPLGRGWSADEASRDAMAPAIAGAIPPRAVVSTEEGAKEEESASAFAATMARAMRMRIRVQWARTSTTPAAGLCGFDFSASS